VGFLSGCTFHLLEFCEIIKHFNWISFFGHLFVGNNAFVSDKFLSSFLHLLGKNKSNKKRWLEPSLERQKGKPQKGQKTRSPQEPKKGES
jgi:hypothetical protein